MKRDLRPRDHLLAFVALLVLAGTTLGLSFLDLGAAAVPVALGIAVIKATIVSLVFMHLLEHPFTVGATAITAWVFVAILVVIVTADVATREPVPPLPPSALLRP